MKKMTELPAECCGTCKYFCRHYVWFEAFQQFNPMIEGHCVAHKRVRRRQELEYCEEWELTTETPPPHKK